MKRTLLNKYLVSYYQCDMCELIHTERPYWLEESYCTAITSSDTGIMHRNEENARLVCQLYKKLNITGAVLDFGGGYGILTRMLRDKNIDCYWYDKFAKNLVACGFEWGGETSNPIDLLLAFEVMEHTDDPQSDWEKVFEISDTVLVSTLLYDGQDIDSNSEWWYWGDIHGQHISFYDSNTMKYIANKFSVNYYKLSEGMHLFSKRIIGKRTIKMLGGGRKNQIIREIEYYMMRKSLTLRDSANIVEFAESIVNDDK